MILMNLKGSVKNVMKFNVLLSYTI